MELPVRKRIRLEHYDYASNGVYFVTVCLKGTQLSLWQDVGADSIRPHQPTLSSAGQIVDTAIQQIPLHYPGVAVVNYCIMPDHIHLLLAFSRSDDGRIISAPTLSVVVGQMKRWVSKQLGQALWQKSFYDEVIRDEDNFLRVWQYIDNNPRQLTSPSATGTELTRK